MTKLSTIQKMTPLNMEQEQKKFFFDSRYNPQFVYDKNLSAQELNKYGNVSFEYLNVARNIIQTVMAKWKTESTYLLESEGETLSREQLNVVVRKYLEEYGLDKQISTMFSRKFIAQTSMQGDVLRFRLPISHRQNRVLGTLEHEVGTHYMRTMNDKQQPWRDNRKQYDLDSYLETEEGLAVLNSHLYSEHKHLWFAALFYYLIYQSSKMSFAELNQDLMQYVDSKERRWSLCLRAKRGMTDTSVPGAVAKDQVYLHGTIKVLRWLRAHEYDPRPLYIGKIDVDDLDKAWAISPDFKPVLPIFLRDGLKSYTKAIKQIEEVNGLDKVK